MYLKHVQVLVIKVCVKILTGNYEMRHKKLFLNCINGMQYVDKFTLVVFHIGSFEMRVSTQCKQSPLLNLMKTVQKVESLD